MTRLDIDLQAISHNTRLVRSLCATRDIRVTAVTKGVLADLPIVRQLSKEGVASFGDSRLKNILKMRAAGIRGEFHLIRAPAPGELDELLWLADVSYHSETEVVKRLANLAAAYGERRRVILMVDVGDRREGIMPEEVLETARTLLGLKGISLFGLGMNVGCVNGVLPSPANMGLLVELARDIESRLGHRLEVISGGASMGLTLVADGTVPSGINHFRVGTAIWLGDYNTWDEPIPGARHDAFDLVAPVIELKWKPSLPVGEIGLDAFGRRPVFEDRGPMLRAICSLGRQDVYVEGIEPRRSDLRILAASSDHLLLDVTVADPPIRVGEEVHFRLSYGALLYAMQSTYVAKRYRE